jgi:hypothetical protein
MMRLSAFNLNDRVRKRDTGWVGKVTAIMFAKTIFDDDEYILTPDYGSSETFSAASSGWDLVPDLMTGDPGDEHQEPTPGSLRPKHKCYCKSRDIFHYGCRCGGV